jgi:hypothetical protein
MNLITLKNKILDHISNNIELEDVPYTIFEGEKQVSDKSMELAAEHIMFMLIKEGIVKIEQE